MEGDRSRDAHTPPYQFTFALNSVYPMGLNSMGILFFIHKVPCELPWGIVRGDLIVHNALVNWLEAQALTGGEKTHFTISEVARILGRPIQTLHYWLKSGRIRRRDRTSARGNYLIPRAELVRLLEDAGREVPGLWERRRLKVLVIDDDRGIRSFALLAARSARMPLSMRTAGSVEDGLLLAAQFRPEVILLDTSFPKDKLRGDQGLAFIRGTKMLRKVRVVAMVLNARTGQGMLRGGADAVLQKPFGLAEFRDAILPKREAARGSRRGSKKSEGSPAL